MEIYIRMCKEAGQLQKLWKPKVGDFVWRRYTFFNEEIDKRIWNKREEIIILTYTSDVDGYFHATRNGETRIFNSHNEAHKATCIWLPTQEQLQEMILSNPNIDANPIWLISKFKFFTDRINLGRNEPVIDGSMNELWLAFIMHEKYNKIWTGEKWVKAE